MMRNILVTIVSVIITTSAVYLIAFAGVLNPSVAPADTQVTLADIYCRVASCTPTVYGLDSSGAATGTMYTLQDIYDIVPKYKLQPKQVVDDSKCVNNNGESNSACAASDAEFTGEETAWASATDTNLSGALVASGKVYHDLTTGLYWADGYDSTSGQGSVDLISNNFTIGTGCTDVTINNGTCSQDNYQTKGNAIQYCLDLSLDSNGDGTDETDWYLPSQKEILQGYVDGMSNNLPNMNYYYWSSTEYSSNILYVLNTNLATAFTTVNLKTDLLVYARCVRR